MKARVTYLITVELGNGYRIGGIIATRLPTARRAAKRLYREWKKEGARSARIVASDGSRTETVAGIREDWEAA